MCYFFFLRVLIPDSTICEADHHCNHNVTSLQIGGPDYVVKSVILLFGGFPVIFLQRFNLNVTKKHYSDHLLVHFGGTTSFQFVQTEM